MSSRCSPEPSVRSRRLPGAAAVTPGRGAAKFQGRRPAAAGRACPRPGGGWKRQSSGPSSSKRLDGVAAILATTAVQDAGLLALLAEGSGVSEAARSLKREMLRGPRDRAAARGDRAYGDRYSFRRLRAADRAAAGDLPGNWRTPFLAPDFSAVPQSTSRPRRLVGWELLGPLPEFLRTCRRGSPGVHGAPGADGNGSPRRALETDAAPGAAGRPRPRPVTGHSCSPMSRVWARRPRRCSPRRQRTPTRLLVVVPNVVKTNWGP